MLIYTHTYILIYIYTHLLYVYIVQLILQPQITTHNVFSINFTSAVFMTCTNISATQLSLLVQCTVLCTEDDGPQTFFFAIQYRK